MTYVDVVFNLPLKHTFTYSLPAEFKNIDLYSRVLVPFGKRTLTAIVVNKKDKTDLNIIKPVLDILDTKPLILPEIFQLIKWISHYYLCSLGQALQLALPKGLDISEQENVFLVEESFEISLTERQRELFLLISDNPGKNKAYYRKKVGASSFYTNINLLHKKGLIYFEKSKTTARVKELLRKFIFIPENYLQSEGADKQFKSYLNKKTQVFNYLEEHKNENILLSEFLKKTGMARSTLQKMVLKKIVFEKEQALQRKPEFDINETEQEIVLNHEQKIVIDQILRQAKQKYYKPFLLKGITGSGKTVVYIEVLKEIIKAGKNAIILIPEIALTPQTVSRFKKNFTDIIAVFHSKMSVGERFDAWMACYKEQVRIVIGPRSALFAPLKNIGLIVVDEEHETSYKQTDMLPLYNARDVALVLGKMNNAVVVLGSATPSFESYFNALSGKYNLLELSQRAKGQRLPEVELVNLKSRKAEKKHSMILSEKLISAMENCLQKNEQVIILQNRRGYAAFQQCMHCGYIVKCTDCDIALTFHSWDSRLRCHMCGFSIPAHQQCINCGSDELLNNGPGTQQLEDIIINLFPESNLLRMDQDSTKAKNSHSDILNRFRDGMADILLGTQMISKGLDFPNVTLVGVVSADVGLNIPDVRSSERVFQLLTQVSGRAGRGDKKGKVIIQTYRPEHFAIQHATKQDYTAFYNHELAFRDKFKYPPFTRMIQINVMSADVSSVIGTSRYIARQLNKRAKKYCTISGPAPAVIARQKKIYRWQIFVKIELTSDPAGNKTKRIIKDIIEPYERKNNNEIKIQVDVDPL